MLPPDLARIQPAFDALSVVSDTAFRQVTERGKLRYAGADGRADLVDGLSARLACSVLRAARPDPALIVLPDHHSRRCPLLFSTALVTDAVAHRESGAVGHRVLYVAQHAGIRSQLKDVQLATFKLDEVFSQQYGSGQGSDLQRISTGGLRLPSVLCIQAPADAAGLIRQHRPKWIAVDCGDAEELAWLPALLAEAKRTGTPVVGWAIAPLAETAKQWVMAGGGVFRWPRRRDSAKPSVDSLQQLVDEAVTAEVTPYVLTGEHVSAISRSFVVAAESLLAARVSGDGRLCADAVAIGWRCLRAMESLPVPLDVYEREAGSHWGMRRIGELRGVFTRFIEAIQSVRVRGVLQEALDALTDAQQRLESAEPPLWLGLASLCVEGDAPRDVLFPTNAHRKMFSHCLLARFNIGERDLRGIGVRLRSLSRRPDDDDAGFDGTEASTRAPGPASSFLAGLPNRRTEMRLEPFLQSSHPGIVIWPHHEEVLQRRLRVLSSELALSSRGLRAFLPTLERAESDAAQHGDGRSIEGLRTGRTRQITSASPGGGLERTTGATRLWRRPDSAQAIAGLFGAVAAVEDDDDALPLAVGDDATGDTVDVDGDESWVQEAVVIRVDDGRCLVLPSDEHVNVIVRGPNGVNVEQRYVRSLRGGDEILFIQGQRRQSLYALLVSRVHRNPTIAQYLALVARWQDDFTRAFRDAERAGKMSADGLLQEIRARGSQLTSACTVRSWLKRLVLAPNDAEDLKRISDVLSLAFVAQYYRQIHWAGRRLKGLHINLSARLNRWLATDAAGAAALSDSGSVIDAELGLTVEDFRHSLLRLRVVSVTSQQGPFYRPHLGHLEEGRT